MFPLQADVKAYVKETLVHSSTVLVCLFVFLFSSLTGRIFLAPTPTDHCTLVLPGPPSPMAIYLFFLLLFSFPLSPVQTSKLWCLYLTSLRESLS